IDGTAPTSSSAVYAAPLSVDATTVVNAFAVKTGWSTSPIATSAFTMKAVRPTFSPSGGSFGSPQTVTISTSTPSTTIRYTIDGSDPSQRSPLYVGAMMIDVSMTIKARAYKAGYTASAVTAATFGVDAAGAVDTPTLTPGSGWSTTARAVTVTVQAPDAT